MADIHFDVSKLSPDQAAELETWVRSLIGNVAEKCRPYGRIATYTSGRILLHLSQVVTDDHGNPVLDLAKEPSETATMPLVVELDGKNPWPAWLEQP